MDLWRDASAREWIVRWLNAYCDYSMTIDIPIWTKTNSKADGSPFRHLSFDQDLELTLPPDEIAEEADIAAGMSGSLNR